MQQCVSGNITGLGNDFLVALTDDQPDDDTASGWARKLCRRRRGVGADGMILATLEPIAMRLWNSDGSPAEVSGNGLRCLAHAIARYREAARLEVVVSTASGPRRCTVMPAQVEETGVPGVEGIPASPASAGGGGRVERRAGRGHSGGSSSAGGGGHASAHSGARLADAAVVAEMGVIGIGADGPCALPGSPDPGSVVEDRTGVGVRRWGTADAGNPHIVMLVDDPGAVPLEVAGPAVEELFPDGVNVHFAAVTGDAGSGSVAVLMRTWERGAGVTEACGTGAVSAAAVLRGWNLTGDRVTVRMPGGDAEASLKPRVTLSGPSSHVAAVVVDGI